MNRGIFESFIIQRYLRLATQNIVRDVLHGDKNILERVKIESVIIMDRGVVVVDNGRKRRFRIGDGREKRKKKKLWFLKDFRRDFI